MSNTLKQVQENAAPSIRVVDKTLNSIDSFIELTNAKAPQNEEQFYKATFDIFKEINNLITSFKGHVLSESAQYDMLSMVQEYQHVINGFQQYSDNKKELEDFGSIWELAIQLYIAPETDNKQTVLNLVDWLNHFDPIEPNKGDKDWIALFRNVLRGNVEEAIDLLASFGLDQEENKFVEPLYSTLKEYRNVASELDLDHWKKKCGMQLESIQSTVTAEFQFKDEFIWIYFLLIGNAEYIRRTGTFFDQLMGAVQYYKLYASRREIITIAAELDCTQFKDQRSFVCAALLLGRIDDALQYCNNIWMQTHLGHAFLALEVRAESEPSVSSSLDTEVTVDPIYYIADTYAHMIASKYNMWTEAVVYISLCVPNRGVWIERLLSLENAKHIPLLQSVLETVDEYSIDEVKSFIHKSIGQLYEQEHNVHKATIEYGKAQDIQSLDRVGKDLLNKCLETGQLQDNVIGHEELSSSPIYDCVMKYNDLRNYLENKQYKEASRLVLDIFTSNTLPDEFKPMIFIDGDAILSRKESYYKQNELIELLDIFQALLDALSSQTYFEQYYQHALGTKYSADTIIAMLREKMSYRAMIATES